MINKKNRLYYIDTNVLSRLENPQFKNLLAADYFLISDFVIWEFFSRIGQNPDALEILDDFRGRVHLQNNTTNLLGLLLKNKLTPEKIELVTKELSSRVVKYTIQILYKLYFLNQNILSEEAFIQDVFASLKTIKRLNPLGSIFDKNVFFTQVFDEIISKVSIINENIYGLTLRERITRLKYNLEKDTNDFEILCGIEFAFMVNTAFINQIKQVLPLSINYENNMDFYILLDYIRMLKKIPNLVLLTADKKFYNKYSKFLPYDSFQLISFNSI